MYTLEILKYTVYSALAWLDVRAEAGYLLALSTSFMFYVCSVGIQRWWRTEQIHKNYNSVSFKKIHIHYLPQSLHVK